jgi:hypothetical protein
MAKALSLAHTEGYMRAILEEGAAVSDLPRMTIVKGVEAVYANMQLGAF